MKKKKITCKVLEIFWIWAVGKVGVEGRFEDLVVAGDSHDGTLLKCIYIL